MYIVDCRLVDGHKGRAAAARQQGNEVKYGNRNQSPGSISD